MRGVDRPVDYAPVRIYGALTGKEVTDISNGSGNYKALNKSIVNVAEVNGTMTILINGTLPNDTALAGDEASNSAPARHMAGALGFWPAVAAVVGAVFIS
ncbi:hypothetical protein HZS61_008339 [Fusarium oxysporum f. sp. conglutinans]|uniref:DUF7732 domain-containing protein n=1 Tax=Fusarium oxysporum f. sp. conglutinans TaxID=100902 RepID=A0A8H6H2J5_FUSOX|nr:hypothetical protein HZS61_008339 [Fusarium oxysporum f. sp. conglutinans]KAG7000380.1 hypothetical protein FocnCong_v012875 [Fusarium oxysporum f. sp. conglutinans]KAI8416820.1 hypothetical protein FOFC_03133 [Fusarium oxysporum]